VTTPERSTAAAYPRNVKGQVVADSMKLRWPGLFARRYKYPRVGGGVIVCPGVTIADNTVVGAGAVVTRDLPANVVAVGNPARVVRQL
jgi:hypothetical protein